jgi:hypothetical protein
VDLSEVTGKLDALAAQIAALVDALATKQEPSVAPVAPTPIVLPIQMAQPVSAGKSVSVRSPTGEEWTVNVSANGATPNVPEETR